MDDIAQVIIKQELEGIYGGGVLRDMRRAIEMYDAYDGGMQLTMHGGINGDARRTSANWIKKLIKAQARFMFGKAPEINISSDEAFAAQAISGYINNTLSDNSFSEKLIKAARDCFITGSVALKLGAKPGGGISVQFKPSVEYIYETFQDDISRLSKVIFFYCIKDDTDKARRRIWKQKYYLEGGRCLLSESIHDGHGRLVEKVLDREDTSLDFIPVRIIINDGLSGDLNGESDVYEAMNCQAAYDTLMSDDLEALRFNMFPQRLAINASGNSLENMVIAPGALIDLQTDPAVDSGQADMRVLEANFNYGTHFEETISRVKADMFELLSVPNIGLEQLKGFLQSGKSMKAIYWDLICRCEEKWTTWRPAMEWMARSIIKIASAYGEDLPDADFSVFVDNIYPLPDDETDEKAMDIKEIISGARSRESYIKKWRAKEDAEAELAAIARELSGNNKMVKTDAVNKPEEEHYTGAI